MQISIYVINNMPEPGRNLAADACMGRTQLSPCIYNFSTRTIRASRNAMPAWYFFHAEPLISRFSLEKYITLLQQLWQTVLMWNLYPIFISLNQLAVKITPAESFLWMHLHQFQYLYAYNFQNIGFASFRILIRRLTAGALAGGGISWSQSYAKIYDETKSRNLLCKMCAYRRDIFLTPISYWCVDETLVQDMKFRIHSEHRCMIW